MTRLRLILGDQLSASISSLENMEANDIILMCEVMEEATYVQHHPKKIAFLFSAMRHFARELEAQGHKLRYVTLDNQENTGSFAGEARRALKETGAAHIVITEPGEYRLLKTFETWSSDLGVSVEIRPDTRFLCSREEFRTWASNRRQLRMEYFYRDMRKKYRLLIENDDAPTGGQWNFDKENRKPPRHGLSSPKRISHVKDEITKDVIALVKKRFFPSLR